MREEARRGELELGEGSSEVHNSALADAQRLRAVFGGPEAHQRWKLDAEYEE